MTELKANIKEFLANTKHATHANHIKTCTARENLLCCCLGSSKSQYPLTNVLIWDTGE